jgi:hypothetical protein
LRSLVLAHPRRPAGARLTVKLAHTEFQIVQIGCLCEESVSAFFRELIGRFGQEQKQAAKQIHGQPRQ